MFDGKGDVLYVGKAKSLKNRVGSYARGLAHSNRIARMIGETASMEFVTTATEIEALLLEANLIKQLRPRYNVLMRDDKSLPYILLTGDHEAPQIVKHRGARKRKGDYYGPFASVWAVNRTINALQRAFLLRSCNDSYLREPHAALPALSDQALLRPVHGGNLDRRVSGARREARDFLSGKSNAVKERITAEMQEAAERSNSSGRRAIATARRARGDAGRAGHQHAIRRGGGRLRPRRAGRPVLRRGLLLPQLAELGQPRLFPKADRSMTPAEVLASFVAQFYDDKPAPRLVLLSHEIEDAELMAAALSTRAEARVEIHAPQRGERRQLIEHVAAQRQRGARPQARRHRLAAEAAGSLGQAFGLDEPPRRVEVYDNSHIMGTNAVGGMIVAGADGFMKSITAPST